MKTEVTPAFQITGTGGVLAAAIKTRFIELRLRDEAGLQADELELVLDDKAPGIIPAKSGEQLVLSLGFRESGLFEMGVFVVDEVVVTGPVRTMIIRARAADMVASLKVRKERAWDATTIGTIVSTIAGEHALTAAIAAEYTSQNIEHMDQTDSDLHFLTRLAEDHGAIATVKATRLSFAPRGAGENTSGDVLPSITLSPEDLIEWRAVAANRTSQGSVKARWYDNAAGSPQYERAGTEAPITLLPNIFPDQETAKAAAEAARKRGIQQSGELGFTMPADPRILAETPLDLQGFREGINGRWIVKSVIHTLNDSGFTTSVEAEASAT